MRSKWMVPVLAAFATMGALADVTAAGQKPCEALINLPLSNTHVTLAQVVAAGTFAEPAGPPGSGSRRDFKGVPEFCRVAANVTPTLDSDIKMEVWMPVAGWNGKFQGEGNGGFAGVLDYGHMAAAVKRGFASAGTDTGHTTTDASWAPGHPQKVIDFGYRGVHEMTVQAKAIIAAYYGAKVRHSYFASCSDGGREALMEAQRFPADYNGIIAGAPANYWTHLLVLGMWVFRATNLDPASYIPADKVPALSAAVLAACDAQDGLKDGLLADPRQCHFDPSTLLCSGADNKNCFTAPQVEALKKIYAGPHDSAGRQIFPGYLPGGEEGPGGWPLWITGKAPGHSLIGFFALGYFTDMVYEKPAWDYQTFDIDQATKLADEKTAEALNATDPNLQPFRDHGGKLLLFHGWDDAAIPATNTINYYQSVVAKLGRRKTDSFVRLFLAPGVQHCGGGPGPNDVGQDENGLENDPAHNIYVAIEQWVEKSTAPAELIATKFADDADHSKGIKTTRPWCAYPQMAKYKGSGDPNDAGNFVCVAGKE
jgi:Tannase and feruloyl esterase